MFSEETSSNFKHIRNTISPSYINLDNNVSDFWEWDLSFCNTEITGKNGYFDATNPIKTTTVSTVNFDHDQGETKKRRVDNVNKHPEMPVRMETAEDTEDTEDAEDTEDISRCIFKKKKALKLLTDYNKSKEECRVVRERLVECEKKLKEAQQVFLDVLGRASYNDL